MQQQITLEQKLKALREVQRIYDLSKKWQRPPGHSGPMWDEGEPASSRRHAAVDMGQGAEVVQHVQQGAEASVVEYAGGSPDVPIGCDTRGAPGYEFANRRTTSRASRSG